MRWCLSVGLLGILLIGCGGGRGNSEAKLTGITAVAGGEGHSIALMNDGTVWAWGWNMYGQLGDGTTTDASTPVQVVGPGGSGQLTGVTGIAGGDHCTIAVEDDGSVWSWGSNDYGQLGNGTITDSPTPIQVVGLGGVGYLTGITTVAAGTFHSVALKSDGTVWSWGNNNCGQLGDNTITTSRTPLQVVGPGASGFLSGVKAIACGGYHTIALMNDGTVWAWGLNEWGQLGDGTMTNSRTPVQVVGPGGSGYLAGITAIAGGVEHTIALRDDGTVWTWGFNVFGQLGNGTHSAENPVPVQVVGPGGSGYLDGIVAISGRFLNTVALKNDGTVWTWGHNAWGELGDGTTNDSTTPIQVVGSGGSGWLTGITAVACGMGYMIALRNDGTVWTWGGNSYTPVQVKRP